MASAGTRSATAVLLFSFSAVGFLFLLLQAPGLAVADLLVSALDRFFDGRGLLELATRRNMILLCHAILLLILRDAGVLGAPARRRSRSPPGEATAGPARPHPDATRSTVVWRRLPRNGAVVAPVHEHDTADRVVVECPPAATTWAAPVQTAGPAAQAAEEAAAVVTKQMIVLAESPTNDHDRAAVVEALVHPTAIAADGERDGCDDDRHIIAVADDDDEMHIDDTAGEHQTAGIGLEMEMELADDRTFEEFIKSQRRQMRQESLRLSSAQATTTRP